MRLGWLNRVRLPSWATVLHTEGKGAAVGRADCTSHLRLAGIESLVLALHGTMSVCEANHALSQLRVRRWWPLYDDCSNLIHLVSFSISDCCTHTERRGECKHEKGQNDGMMCAEAYVDRSGTKPLRYLPNNGHH